jgi:hypothetical protein
MIFGLHFSVDTLILCQLPVDILSALIENNQNMILKKTKQYHAYIFQVFHKLKKYTKHPDFNPEAVGKVSLACMSICQWVLALEHYNEVHKVSLSLYTKTL